MSVSAHDSERGCTGHKWQFTLTDVANDVPLVHVSDQLQGHDVTISTTEVSDKWCTALFTIRIGHGQFF